MGGISYIEAFYDVLNRDKECIMTKPKINFDKKYGLFIGGEFVEGESGNT